MSISMTVIQIIQRLCFISASLYHRFFSSKKHVGATHVISQNCLSEKNQIRKNFSDSRQRFAVLSGCSQTNVLIIPIRSAYLSEKQLSFLYFSDRSGLLVWEKQEWRGFLWHVSEKCSVIRFFSNPEPNESTSETLVVSITSQHSNRSLFLLTYSKLDVIIQSNN